VVPVLAAREMTQNRSYVMYAAVDRGSRKNCRFFTRGYIVTFLHGYFTEWSELIVNRQFNLFSPQVDLK